MWEAIFYLVLSLVITSVMTPKSNNQGQAPAAFGDFDFPQADEGTAQAVYFGECWSTSWTVLAVGDYRVSAIKKKGGKK